MRDFFAQRVPGIVITRSRHPTREFKELSEEYKIPVLRSPLITGRFMNAATVLLEQMSAPRTRVHGTTVDVMGVGVLIEGEPGCLAQMAEVYAEVHASILGVEEVPKKDTDKYGIVAVERGAGPVRQIRSIVESSVGRRPRLPVVG